MSMQRVLSKWFGYSNPDELTCCRADWTRRAGVICYTIFFCLLHFSKALDLDSQDAETWYFLYPALVFLFFKFIFTDWRWQELAIGVPLVVFGFVLYRTSGLAALFLSILAVVGTKGIAPRRLFRIIFWVRIGGLLLLSTIHCTPVADWIPEDSFFFRYTPYALYDGFASTKYGWGVFGYLNKNMASMQFCILILLLVYFIGKQYNIIWMALLLAANVTVYEITKCRTTLLAVSFLLILRWLLQQKRGRRAISFACAGIPVVAFLVLLITQALYSEDNDLLLKLDLWLSYRVVYVKDYFTYVPFTLLGQDLNYYATFLDSAILVLLFDYGMLAFSLGMTSITVLLLREARRGETTDLSLSSGMVVIAALEQYPLSVNINPFLLFFSEFLFEPSDEWQRGKPMAQSLDRHRIQSVSL